VVMDSLKRRQIKQEKADMDFNPRHSNGIKRRKSETRCKSEARNGDMYDMNTPRHSNGIKRPEARSKSVVRNVETNFDIRKPRHSNGVERGKSEVRNGEMKYHRMEHRHSNGLERCKSEVRSTPKARNGNTIYDRRKVKEEKEEKEELKSEVEDRRKVEQQNRLVEKRKASSKYVALQNKLTLLEPDWTNIESTSSSDRVEARIMQIEVYEGPRIETVEEWDEQAAKIQSEDGQWDTDYIICCEEREMGDDKCFKLGKNGRSRKVLIKWSGFPVPTWESTEMVHKGIKTYDFQVRLLLQDFIELNIRQTHGDEYFEEHYPNRYLEYERGRGEGGYVEDPLALYKNRLRANEHYYNTINYRSDRGLVYVEDWTGLPPDDQTLMELEWIQKVVLSRDVEELQKRFPQPSFHDLKCSKACSDCTARNERTKKIKYCCGMSNTIDVDDSGKPFFIESGEPEVHGVSFLAFVSECTDACGCNKNKCQNRVVQKGRSKPLCIFRDAIKEKGWGLRYLTEFAEDDFVVEYCGEIKRSRTKGEARFYDYDLVYKAQREDGKRKRFTLNAYAQGNEGRFISHGCEPNLDFWMVAVDRIGLPFCRSVLYARRNIARGEEATVDYYGGSSLGSNGCDAHNMFPESGCQCGSKSCRFTRKKIADYLE
ncbi:hypothetical protein PMAYCL1PPCAC_22173, partial [Pristionchus mayeri]